LVLFPIMYFISLPAGEKRRNFLKFNLGFFMINIHLLNLPLAYLNVLSGERVRQFTHSDLWVSYLVVMLYSIIVRWNFLCFCFLTYFCQNLTWFVWLSIISSVLLCNG
jgi:hypothetical protein